MMDSIILGFQEVAHWQVIAALLIGAIAGILVGAIPGMEPAGAMAIALPFTLTMEPLPGIILLLGCYGGAWYGGAIPAILIRVPGTPVNVLTTYDGYPLAQKGHPMRALSLAYSSSFVGGIISILALIFLAPFMAKIAAKFGPPEFAAVMILASVSVVLAHHQNIRGAILTFGIGMFLGTVGFESPHHTLRYTFDQTWLLGGIPMVPMVIGLFALSQAFILLETKSPPKVPENLSSTGRFVGLLEVFKYRATVIRSSLIGLVMGLLPGVGEFGAQFLSYSLARRFSKKPEEFGKGSPEGLVASEVSINACTSTVLVPLLSLGIPADPLMAMLLAVFMIHNIVPGPQLFVEHADFISGLYISLFLLNIFVMIFLLIFTKYVVRLSSISPRVIGAAIMILGFIGTYTQNFRITDGLVALAFAIVGRFMLKNGVPAFPMVVGLVLGPMMEGRIKQAFSISNGDPSIFLTRPLAATFLTLAVVAVVTFSWNHFRNKTVEAH
ncbi:tripartite tricarboxylate transporter permease [Rhizobium giardinii]|uniref:Putative tricarboxylic transport membrane protein n=1 Tax=Rhizobium giardinii TaxID=56731 RepID=A0A7W8UGX6_9HYPH|nr:tripartite tricarboxylate transporter permease [Rhizobium giardinii]MBB5539176.1 putative tricarboxylic transport membrane protein [Rhizobium giardinii]